MDSEALSCPHGSEGLGLGQRVFPNARYIIPWHPKPNRYLLALCSFGRVSNILMCQRRYMAVAALLNRTLVVPMKSLSTYDPLGQISLSPAFDLPRAKRCMGPGRLLSLDEYREAREGGEKGAGVTVTVLWWVDHPSALELCGRINALLPEVALEGRSGSCQPASFPWQNVGRNEFLKKFGARNESMISFGDIFLVTSAPGDGFPGLYDGPNGPLLPVPPCKLVMQPTALLLEAAHAFARSVLGRDFIAVHLRRGDFADHCKRRGFECWFPLRQLAWCVAQKLRHPLVLGGEVAPTIFLSTDASEKEASLFQSLVNGLAPEPVAFVRMPENLRGVSGLGLLQSAGAYLLTNELTRSLLDKLVCVKAKAFWGSPRSTFTKRHCADAGRPWVFTLPR